MSEHTRRGFLRTTGIGVAAVGAAAMMPADPAAAAPGATSSDAFTIEAVPSDTSLVAHVRDVKTGTIALLIGEREVVITDRALTARLLRAAG